MGRLFFYFLAILVGCYVSDSRNCSLLRDSSKCNCEMEKLHFLNLSEIREEGSSIPVEQKESSPIYIDIGVEPPTLMPMLKPDAWASRIVEHNIYESLVSFDFVKKSYKGELAESWSYDTERKCYQFKLREGVFWHDGVEFTGRDILFTFDKLLDPEIISLQKSYFEDVKSYSLLSPYLFEICLKQGSYLFLQNLSHLNIIPEHLWSKGNFNTNPYMRKPVGTGPFKFKEWKSGEHITLIRNENYWGEKPFLKEVVFKFVRDPSVRIDKIKNLEIDIATNITLDTLFSIKDKEWFKKQFNAYYHEIPGFQFIMFNLRNKIFSERSVREALLYMFDLEAIRCSIYKCLTKIITGPIPILHPGYDYTLKPREFSLEKGMNLLKKAGWEDHDGDGIVDKGGLKFKFEFLVPSQSLTLRQIVTIYQEDLKKVGIIMDIVQSDWGIYLKLLKEGRFDLSAFQWITDWEEDYSSIFHSRACLDGANFGCWKNSQADLILDRLKYEVNYKERTELLRKLHKIVYEELPYIFMFAPIEISIFNKKIRGIYPTTNWIELKKLWLE